MNHNIFVGSNRSISLVSNIIEEILDKTEVNAMLEAVSDIYVIRENDPFKIYNYKTKSYVCYDDESEPLVFILHIDISTSNNQRYYSVTSTNNENLKIDLVQRYILLPMLCAYSVKDFEIQYINKEENKMNGGDQVDISDDDLHLDY